MHRCEEEVQNMTRIYKTRLSSLNDYLIDLSNLGKNRSVNYKINSKIAIFLEQVIKDLTLISDKISDENKIKRNSSQLVEE